jgi:hypothetical protein
MGFLRKYFGDPLVGLVAMFAITFIFAIVCSALRQTGRERGYRRYMASKRRGHKD